MSSFLWHTIVDVYANRLAIFDEGRGDVRHAYDYQQRDAASISFDAGPFFRGWPSSSLNSGDGMSWGCCPTASRSFEPSTVLDGGTYRPWFIRGKCTDSNGNPLAACDVEAYVSATDLFQSKGITDQNGDYMLPVNFGPGTNFTVYANYANGTYVGATVATVQSAL